MNYNNETYILEEFEDEKGEFKAMVTHDARGLLCLYEASHLRVQVEDLLEEACEFSSWQS